MTTVLRLAIALAASASVGAAGAQSAAATAAASAAAATAGATARCGDAEFRVDAARDGGHPLANTYRLYGAPHGAAGKLLYTSDVGGWFSAACVKDGGGRPRLLFQSSCGGSGCAEDRFGIVDPDGLALLLRPPAGRRGNIAQADKVLRRKTPWIANDGSAFCCDVR